jgi:hypothetical protein
MIKDSLKQEFGSLKFTSKGRETGDHFLRSYSMMLLPLMWKPDSLILLDRLTVY